jgi:hypothetical protein
VAGKLTTPKGTGLLSEDAGFSRRVDAASTGKPRGFPVTIRQYVGWVSLDDPNAEHNPAEAAMLIIARHGQDGVYEFMGPDENTSTRVTVEWTVPDGT